jgi:hypothetical protein
MLNERRLPTIKTRWRQFSDRAGREGTENEIPRMEPPKRLRFFLDIKNPKFRREFKELWLVDLNVVRQEAAENT